MRLPAIRRSVLLIAAAFLLTACGGGGSDSSGPPLLEIGGIINGRPIVGFVALPGSRQAILVPFGQSFELDANRPVSWSVVVAGTVVPGTGNTITVGGTSVQETLITDFQFVATTFGFAPVPSPLQVTVVATSREDPGQVTMVDVLVGN